MILVTGATGHIGNVLVRELLELGQQVRVLVMPGEDRTPLEGLAVEWAEGDVLDWEALDKAFEGVEIVYHLAGVISILPGRDAYVESVNVQGTQNVLDAAKAAGVRRLVYTSSIHAISRVPHGIIIDESIPYDPDTAISAYDRSKAEATLAVMRAAQAGLDAVITCPTGVIGPYDYRRSEMGHIILNSMRKKLLFCVDGAYDFVDVRDVARGLILACEKGQTGESYILSGERITLLHLMEITQEITGIRSLRLNIPLKLAQFIAAFTPLYYRLTGARPLFTPYAVKTVGSNSFISYAKARDFLGYRPRSSRDTIADAVHWFRENSHLWAHGSKLA